MSLLLPLPKDASLLLTDNDLGRGFALDCKGTQAKKSPVLVNPESHCVTKYDRSDITKMVLIRDHESLREASNIGEELSLSFALISQSALRDNMKASFSTNDHSMTFLFTCRVVLKTVELKHDTPIEPKVAEMPDLECLRTNYGFHYISKIQYGALLEIKITLQSLNEEIISRLKKELSGSLDLRVFAERVKAHINQTNGSVKPVLNVNSSVIFDGCRKMPSTALKGLDAIEEIIEKFEIDEKALVPVFIELLPLLPCLTPLITFDTAEVATYRASLSTVGTNHWHFEYLYQQLAVFKKTLNKSLLEDKELACFVYPILPEVKRAMKRLRKEQKKMLTFIQNETIEHISQKSSHTAHFLKEQEREVSSLVGSAIETTDKGEWRGPVVDRLPIFQGVYKYKDKRIYRGCCLNGLREGPGTLTYPEGNEDGILCIEGLWKGDELTFPSTIKMVDKKQRELKSAADCVKWREEQKAKLVAGSVSVKDHSQPGDYLFKLRVTVEKVFDEDFQQFYRTALKLKKRDKYYIMLMGMTGTGKTTMVEYILNILTGQVHAAKTLRAKELEAAGKAGCSRTTGVCRYEIEYIQDGVWMFCIVVIDTPGFADTAGLETDKEHIQKILTTVSKIEHLNCVSYVVQGSLARKTLEPLKVLCNVFSILPAEAFQCVSTMITFCDNTHQAKGVLSVLAEMLTGIQYKESIFMDNPWSQHLKNSYRQELSSTVPEQGQLFGVDNTEELENKLEAKSAVIREFVLDIIRRDASFSPAGMAQLSRLKSELFERLAAVSAIVGDLHSILNMLKQLTSEDIDSLLAKGKSISLKEWCESQGFAVIDGKPKAKRISKKPFPGGIHSTVCFAPDCTNMKCHYGCSIDYTAKKGDNVFKDCWAFTGEECRICPSSCSFLQHVHTQCELEWVENDEVANTYYAIKNGVAATLEHVTQLQEKANTYRAKYDEAMKHLASLKDQFKKLAVLGDIKLILVSSKRTYEQQKELAAHGDKQQADKIQAIIDQIDAFFKALEESEVSCEKSLFHHIKGIADTGISKAKDVMKSVFNGF